MRRRLLAATIAAVALAATAKAVTLPSIAFTETRLKNGLRVIVAEDHHAPVLSTVVLYDVGSRNERPGRTGFAHLFEHMMFKGSQNVGPGEHFYAIFSNGGTMNGTTSKERTIYFETLPSNQLDVALFLEADRMRSLAIVKENLDNQRNAVQEERRQSYDNQPYGRVSETLDALAFDTFANKHSVIGSMTDLNAASVEDVAAFFKTYYAPNNARLVIAGDVRPGVVLERVRRYFESIPSQSPPPAVDVSEPPQTAERRTTLDDPLARLPRVDIAYRIPSSRSADDDTFDVLDALLASGRSSRLYETLVRQKQLAVSVNTSVPPSRGPRLFRIAVTAAPGQSLDEVEAAVYAEIERVKSGPIAEWEIEKARNLERRDLVSSVGSSLTRARLLAEYALFYGDANVLNARLQRLSAFSAADVQRVAKQYLVPESRTVVITRPRAAASANGGR